MASTSTTVKKNFKPAKGTKMSLAAFKAESEQDDVITHELVFEHQVNILQGICVPEEEIKKIQTLLQMEAKQTTPVAVVNKVAPQAAVETKAAPEAAVETKAAPEAADETKAVPEAADETTATPEVAVETTATPEVAVETTAAPEVAVETTTAPEEAVASSDAAFAAASLRAQGGATPSSKEAEPIKLLNPYKASVVLLSFIMSVNRIFNADKHKKKLPAELASIFEEFRQRLFSAPYDFAIPADYGIPSEFIENLGRAGVVPQCLILHQEELISFLEAHLDGLNTVGVKIDLNQDVIDLASKCTSTSVAINFSKLISSDQRKQLRLRFCLALSAVKYAVPDGLTFLPESVIVLLKANFPNIVSLLTAVNTSKKMTRIENFHAFVETPLYKKLSSGQKFDVIPDHLERIFAMLPSFCSLLHMASVNANRMFSNQTLSVTSPSGKSITFVFPRLMLGFQRELSNGINQADVDTALTHMKNHSMMNLTFVCSTVASILVAAYVSSNEETCKMVFQLEDLFIQHSQNIAAIKAIKSGDKMSLFATGNELVNKICNLLHDMYEVTRLNEALSTTEATLFDAFFEGVNKVTPVQKDRPAKGPGPERTGLSAFDAFPSLGATGQAPAPKWTTTKTPYKSAETPKPTARATGPPPPAERKPFHRTAAKADEKEPQPSGWD
jgi:hypothetical protein